MKKRSVFITILFMIIAGFAVTSYAADKEITGLGTGTMTNPAIPESTEVNWSGSFVYYGNYNGVYYRALSTNSIDFGGHTLLLDCNYKVTKMVFNDHDSQLWKDSLLRNWLNGDEFLGNKDVFTPAENAAIAVSKKNEPSPLDGHGAEVEDPFTPLSEGDNIDRIFVLDAREATRRDYGYNDVSGTAVTRIKECSNDIYRWWLRTADDSDPTNVIFVGRHDITGVWSENGKLSPYTLAYTNGVSPAFNVNLSSIIFSYNNGNENDPYKLTLSDDELGIKVTKGKKVTRTGNEIKVPYTITKKRAASANRISVLILDEEYVPGKAKTSGFSYLKLADPDGSVTTGTGVFTLPEGYDIASWGKDYFVYILAEEVNAPARTDYASTPVLLSVPEEAEPEDPEEPEITFKLGTGTISDPKAPESVTSSWIGSYVYYGKYEGNPTRYRVLDKASDDFGVNAGSLFLNSDKTLYKACFDKDNNPNGNAKSVNDWEYSDIKTGLNGEEFLTKSGTFTEAERNAIAGSKVGSHELKEGTGAGQVDSYAKETYVNYTPLKGEKIFLLDVEDVSNTAYGYSTASTNAVNRMKIQGASLTPWWLRSASKKSSLFVGYIKVNGDLGGRSTDGDTTYVSPAFNVDLSSVIFSSLIAGEEGEPGAEYKLAVSDSGMNVKINGKITRDGNKLTIPYEITGTNKENVSRVFAVFTDGVFNPETGWDRRATDGNNDIILCPGKDKKYNIPDEYADKKPGIDYHIYLVAAEEKADIHETDYASVPLDITKVQTVVFKVKNGEWNNGGSGDKTLTLNGFSGSLMLSSGDIPSVGEKPADGYKAGKWDKEPKADTAITGDVTYTYSYEKKSEDDPNNDPDDPNDDPDHPKPVPAPKTPSENAIEAMNKGFMASGDTTTLKKDGKKYILDITSDCQLTVVKGSKFFIKDINGKAEVDKKYKKLLSINKKGKVSAKKPADDLHFSFNRKDIEKKIAVSINIIEPSIEGGKKLSAKTKAGEAFDFATSIPFIAEFGKVKNKGVAENLIYEGEAAIGKDGKLHIKGTALKKGKVTIPFTVYGKKYKAIITVKKK